MRVKIIKLTIDSALTGNDGRPILMALYKNKQQNCLLVGLSNFKNKL